MNSQPQDRGKAKKAKPPKVGLNVDFSLMNDAERDAWILITKEINNHNAQIQYKQSKLNEILYMAYVRVEREKRSLAS